MKIEVQDDYSLQDALYNRLMLAFEQIRLIQGPLVVNGTLRKHPKIKKFLHNHQKSLIFKLESNIS
jgi:hypothetical protein